MFFPFPGFRAFVKGRGREWRLWRGEGDQVWCQKNVLKIRKILTYKRFGLDDFGQSYAKGHFW